MYECVTMRLLASVEDVTGSKFAAFTNASLWHVHDREEPLACHNEPDLFVR